MISYRGAIFAGSALAALLPAMLQAQTAPAPTQGQPAARPPQPEPASSGDEGEEVESIVVNGQRPPGSVIGDIQPEVTLSPADVRSYGVSSVTDLLNELSPQTGSGQGDGGPPVVLLNGKRISGMAEIRDLPTEAIARVEILPEEVALKYGYQPDQKVVNIVLRRRFRATTAQAIGTTTTDGGASTGQGEGGLLRIRGDARLNLDVKYQRSGGLLESQRGVTSRALGQPYDFAGNITSAVRGGEIDPELSALAGEPVTVAGVPAGAASGAPGLADFVAGANAANVSDVSPYRSLSPSSDQLSLNAVLARPLGNVSATINGTFDATGSKSLRGLPGAGLTLPAGNPFSPFAEDVMLYRYPAGLAPLAQRTSGESGHIGTTLNGQIAKWNWTFTGTYDRDVSRTTTTTGIDVSALQAQLDADDPDLNPFADLPPGLITGRVPDRARSVSNTGDIELTVNGTVGKLPAGPITTTLKLEGSFYGFDSSSSRSGAESSSSLSRQQGSSQLNVDLPVVKRTSPIGSLTANVNGAVSPVSGFGTLNTWGYGFNWKPHSGLAVIFSVTDTDSAPTLQQLGNPTVATPDVRVFDYRTGNSVDVTRITGGNPDLDARNRHILKVGLNWKPMEKQDLTLVANFVKTTIRNQAATLPAPTAAIEAAFPDRFIRDDDGDLIRIDNRPVNFAEENRSQLRWGFNFSKRLRSNTQKLIAAYRAAGVVPPQRRQFPAGAGGGQRPAGDSTPPSGDGATPRPADGTAPADQGGAPGGGPGGAGFGGGRPGGGFGGGRGGFGGGQGAQGGRLQFALYHTWMFRDDLLIRPGIPVLDLLDGASLGSSGGQSRHRLEAQAGYNNNGLGMRISANWKSATTVRGGGMSAAGSGDLHFSDLTTANFRLFADLGQIPAMVRHPWARGMRVTLQLDNMFNERQRVHDDTGATPVAYQPAYLDPLGRTVRLTVRKLFF